MAKRASKTATYPLAKARRHFSELIASVTYSGVRVELTKHGKVVAAIVPASDVPQEQAA